MKKLHPIALLGLALMAAGTTSQAQTLGSSYHNIASLYSGASSVRIDGEAALELRDIDYAGLHWSRVDFIFDRGQKLSRMQMTSRGASYDEILQIASQQLTTQSDTGDSLAGDKPTSMQIRVCEDDAGEVTVTYEPYTSNS